MTDGFNSCRNVVCNFTEGYITEIPTMGAGGQMKQPPLTRPPFTLSDLKKAIPPHCFRPTVLRSFSYAFRDLAFLSLFYYIAINYFENLPRPLLYIVWPLYWMCQGCVMIALWILGHECGHHAFSRYQWLDDIVGLIIHSALLTPYFSWKIAHRRHHLNTSSVEREEVHVPKLKSELGKFDHLLITNPLVRVFNTLVIVTIGWPMNLCFNLKGRKYEQFTSHFYPYSPFFSSGDRAQVHISNAAVLTVAYGFYRLAVVKGLAWFTLVHGIPMLFMGIYFILITTLQHTHAAVPHYDNSEWDWMRGSLATIDRDYGIFSFSVFHNVEDTHVLHHLFSTIPHYHAVEATKAIKPILGDYYHYDRTPFLKAFWREVNECVYIEADQRDDKRSGVFWYGNKI